MSGIRLFYERDFVPDIQPDGKPTARFYPEQFWESNECYRLKLRLYPEGCLAYTDDQDQMIGYTFGHPWRKDYPIVPLNELNLVLQNNPDCFYIHDVSVLPPHRGKGIGKLLAKTIISLGLQHYDTIKLVSVQNSNLFWEKFGFTAVGIVPSYAPNETGIIMILNYLKGD